MNAGKDHCGRDKELECVLPDGRFATFTRPTWQHCAIAFSICARLENPHMFTAAIFAQCGTIDGHRVEFKDLVAMDGADFAPINFMVSKVTSSYGLGVG